MTESAVTEPTTTSNEADIAGRIRQSVQISDAGPCRKHLKVTVEEAEIRDRFEAKFSELAADAQVRGFRPGKAPRKLIENRYRREILEQMKNELLLQSLEQLSQDKSISPISPPDLDPRRVDIPEKGEFVYEFEVEVRPEFQLPEYKGLKLKKPVHTYTPEEIAKEEKRVLATYGLPEEKKGAVELGDRVTVSGPVKHGDREIGRLKNTAFVVDQKLAFKDGIANKFGDQIKGNATIVLRDKEIVLRY